MSKVLVVKIRDDEETGRAGSISYNNKVNLHDFKQIACVLSDLEVNGANIEKAFEEFKLQKEKGWPF